MRTQKFWGLVEKYPWLLRLIDLADHFRPKSIDETRGTEELGIYLAKTLPESVGWIAVRPWSFTLLNMKTATDESGDIAEKRRVVRGKCTTTRSYCFELFWHERGERPFARHEGARVDLDIGDCITAIRERKPSVKIIIDAVVRINYKTTEMLAGWCDATESLTFDLYFPGSNQSVTRKRA